MKSMNRAFTNAKVIVFILFLVITAITWAWEFLYELPKERCEKGGGWWAARWRACGQPLDLEKMPRLSAAAPAQAPPPAALAAKAAPAQAGH